MPLWAEECGNRDLDWDDCLQVLGTPFERFKVEVMAFSPDAVLAASGHVDGSIEIWNSSNNQTYELAGLSNLVVDLAFSTDGKMLAACDQVQVCGIWDVSSGHLMRTTALHLVPFDIAVSRDGLTMVVAGGTRDRGTEKGIRNLKFVFWDVMTGDQAEREGVEIHDPSGKFTISPDLTAAAFPRHDSVYLVRISETGQKTSKQILMGHEDGVGGATFSPDSKTVATACLRSVRTWDVTTSECKLVIQTGFRGSDLPPPAPIISPDGYTVAARFWRATFTEKYIGLWSTENGTKRKQFAMNYTASDHASAFSPDGESFALLSSGEGRHIGLTTWDTLGASDTEQPVQLKLRPLVMIALSEAKQVVAVAFRDGSIELWNVATNNAIAERTLTWKESAESGFVPVDHLQISRNGKRLAYGKSITSSSAGQDKDDVRIRDTETGKAISSSAWNDSDMAGIRIGFYDDGTRGVFSEREVQALPITIPVKYSWLCWNSEPILLLPSQCRLQEAYGSTSLLDAEGNTIALAFTTGKFAVLRFYPSKMQSFLGQGTHLLPIQ